MGLSSKKRTAAKFAAASQEPIFPLHFIEMPARAYNSFK